MTEEEKLNYSEDNIRTLSWSEHIRKRPGMYIGKLGDGSSADDGIYILLKEVLDNSIDEYMMGFGKQIKIERVDKVISVRDYGRGVPLGKVKDVSSKINTGAKYDSKAFKKAVGLNGVGIKAVNALSSEFNIQSFRDGETNKVIYNKSEVVNETGITKQDTIQDNGTFVSFEPDEEIFGKYTYRDNYIIDLIKNYTYLNIGLTIIYNGEEYYSENGLLDLLNEKLTVEPIYNPIHLLGDDIEIVLAHTSQYGDEFYSFVNGQYTTQGGTHQLAYREAISKTIKEHFSNKNFEYQDIRNGLVAAIYIKVEEPVFESQTKIKLGSKEVGPNGPTVSKFVLDFVKENLDNFLHSNQDISKILYEKILESEKERKQIAGITKGAKDRLKKASLYNKKLRDSKYHFNDKKGDDLEKTCLFITEGDSASGSITKSRNPNYQAVFSLKGKPLNTFGLSKSIVYENEEFSLLQAALNIEDGLDSLRYNKVIIATDADTDGMHIRLLLLTFFLQFFPDLVKKGHIYILQTPLFRIRNKQKTNYCYSDEEKIKALKELGSTAEITRFKGLGEISPNEFQNFISDEQIRLEPISLRKDDIISLILEFYMGKNTPERQEYIIDNLREEIGDE